MKISAKVREQAAMICAIAASDSAVRHDRHRAVLDVARDMDIREGVAARIVAIDAWYVALGAYGYAHGPEVYAEAEALLRTGWTP